jgi:hypothetical protein
LSTSVVTNDLVDRLESDRVDGFTLDRPRHRRDLGAMRVRRSAVVVGTHDAQRTARASATLFGPACRYCAVVAVPLPAGAVVVVVDVVVLVVVVVGAVVVVGCVVVVAAVVVVAGDKVVDDVAAGPEGAGVRPSVVDAAVLVVVDEVDVGVASGSSSSVARMAAPSPSNATIATTSVAISVRRRLR